MASLQTRLRVEGGGSSTAVFDAILQTLDSMIADDPGNENSPFIPMRFDLRLWGEMIGNSAGSLEKLDETYGEESHSVLIQLQKVLSALDGIRFENKDQLRADKEELLMSLKVFIRELFDLADSIRTLASSDSLFGPFVRVRQALEDREWFRKIDEFSASRRFGRNLMPGSDYVDPYAKPLKDAIEIVKHFGISREEEKDPTVPKPANQLMGLYVDVESIKSAIRMMRYIISHVLLLEQTGASPLRDEGELVREPITERCSGCAIKILEHTIYVRSEACDKSDIRQVTVKHALSTVNLDRRSMAEGIAMIGYAANACQAGLELRGRANASGTPTMVSTLTVNKVGIPRSGPTATTAVDSGLHLPSQIQAVRVVNRAYKPPPLAYPLPINLAETHRQSLRTLMTTQLFDGPIISSVYNEKRPPTRVLEVACGSAVWSMMCSRYFARHGHTSISFTGIDIVPQTNPEIVKKTGLGRSPRWRFVQHDIRNLPWPFLDGEFDLIMVKDVSLCIPSRDFQSLFEEYVRLLRPGGVLEVWDTDSTIRLIRPGPLPQLGAAPDLGNNPKSEKQLARKHGVYGVNSNTSLSPPVNLHLVKYNGWVADALNKRGLSPAPCTQIEACLLQESDSLKEVSTVRFAVPLSEIRWEHSRIDQLSLAQNALRKLALETTTGLILSLKPLLKEVNMMNQDEWDTWYFRMVNDLLNDGTGWGECLEVGAWTARKR